MQQLYCGPAPVPFTLATAWNLDLIAISGCALLVLAFLRTGDAQSRVPFSLSLILLLTLFLSPLCALTVALFSARVAHHLLLIAIVAPLLVLAFPERFLSRRGVSLAMLAGLHAVTVWLWHAPPVYAVAIETAPAYWAMQLSLLGSAFLMWRRILAPGCELGPALLALLATIVQMGMLGALLTFAREPLYDAHFATTLPFGLAPIADQQLAGLLMWVPAAIPYLVVGGLLLARQLAPSAPVRGR